MDICFYHASCQDGLTAAWAVRARFPDCEFVPVHYDETPPDVTGLNVAVVDFSFPVEHLTTMCDQAVSVLVLDHHLKALEDLAGFARPNCEIILDMSVSGAVLAWRYFHPDTLLPPLVSYASDRDLWTKVLPDTHEVYACVESYPWTFDSLDDLAGRPLEGVIEEGAAILRYQRKMIAEVAKSAIPVVFEGHPALLCVCPPSLKSEVGNFLVQRDGFEVALLVSPGGAHVSIRTSDDGPNANDLAKEMGDKKGGGHAHAAGFRAFGTEWASACRVRG
jgi:uncharacterized protein